MAGAGPSPQQPQAHLSVFSPESSQRVILHENSGAELHPSPSLHFPTGNRSAQGPQINPGKSRHAGNKQGPSYLSTVPKHRQNFPWQIIPKTPCRPLEAPVSHREIASTGNFQAALLLVCFPCECPDGDIQPLAASTSQRLPKKLN